MIINALGGRAVDRLLRRALLHPATAPMARRVQDIVNGHGLRLLRFGVVGVLGVLVNTAVLFLLVEMGHIHHMVAAGIASEVSILGNFALNDYWTFGDAAARSSWLGRAGRYNVVALGGMAISLAVLFALTTFAGLHYLIANLIAIGTATVSNYVLNSRFTWAPHVEPGDLVSMPMLAE